MTNPHGIAAAISTTAVVGSHSGAAKRSAETERGSVSLAKHRVLSSLPQKWRRRTRSRSTRTHRRGCSTSSGRQSPRRLSEWCSPCRPRSSRPMPSYQSTLRFWSSAPCSCGGSGSVLEPKHGASGALPVRQRPGRPRWVRRGAATAWQGLAAWIRAPHAAPLPLHRARLLLHCTLQAAARTPAGARSL